jgi:hypothetical protein
MFTQKNMSNGFHMVFGNGLTMSVQWHGGNYCANYSEKYNTDKPSPTAEIAVWLDDKAGTYITGLIVNGGAENVLGHLSTDAVAAIMPLVAAFDKSTVKFCDGCGRVLPESGECSGLWHSEEDE